MSFAPSDQKLPLFTPLSVSRLVAISVREFPDWMEVPVITKLEAARLTVVLASSVEPLMVVVSVWAVKDPVPAVKSAPAAMVP